MKQTTHMKWVTAVIVLAAVGSGAWWLGMQQGMRARAPASTGTMADGAAPAATDPGQWTMAQGEDATRRHIQSGL